MGNTTRTIENPTPPRDLGVLLYIIRLGKEEKFFIYYKETIVPYLKKRGVEDAVVWTFKLDNRTLFAIATSPTDPPWYGAHELVRLEEFVEKTSTSEFKNRHDLHIHTP